MLVPGPSAREPVAVGTHTGHLARASSGRASSGARPVDRRAANMDAERTDRRRSYSTADYTDFAHTGPGSLAGRYLRHFWQPVHVAADLPAGHTKPMRVMNEDF